MCNDNTLFFDYFSFLRSFVLPKTFFYETFINFFLIDGSVNISFSKRLANCTKETFVIAQQKLKLLHKKDLKNCIIGSNKK